MSGGIIGAIIAVVLLAIAFFTGRRTSQKDEEILDLTVKIKQNQDKAAVAQKDADAKTKEYLDSLKAYDPDFHSDDDSGPKGSA